MWSTLWLISNFHHRLEALLKDWLIIYLKSITSSSMMNQTLVVPVSKTRTLISHLISTQDSTPLFDSRLANYFQDNLRLYLSLLSSKIMKWLLHLSRKRNTRSIMISRRKNELFICTSKEDIDVRLISLCIDIIQVNILYKVIRLQI